jgi:hypothetical protein
MKLRLSLLLFFISSLFLGYGQQSVDISSGYYLDHAEESLNDISILYCYTQSDVTVSSAFMLQLANFLHLGPSISAGYGIADYRAANIHEQSTNWDLIRVSSYSASLGARVAIGNKITGAALLVEGGWLHSSARAMLTGAFYAPYLKLGAYYERVFFSISALDFLIQLPRSVQDIISRPSFFAAIEIGYSLF